MNKQKSYFHHVYVDWLLSTDFYFRGSYLTLIGFTHYYGNPVKILCHDSLGNWHIFTKNAFAYFVRARRQ